MYRELGAELKIDNKLPMGPVESFKQLLAEQPAWIRDFVKFVQFAPDKQTYNQMDITIEGVFKANNKDEYLIAISDGSVKHMHQMSFGWVLSTAVGVHLATSYGGCDGRGSSLRAEAVGLLSISLFIALMKKYSKRTNIKIVYVSDNLELINRNKEHLNYTDPYPNDTLVAEFDITEQIYLTNQTYNIKVSLQHVYRHQDTRSRGKLSAEAILNVEADRLAREY